MDKRPKIVLLVIFILGLSSLVWWLYLKEFNIGHLRPTTSKNKAVTSLTSQKPTIIKTYNDEFFSVQYPEYLEPISDYYFCDGPNSFCGHPIKYVVFADHQRKGDTSEINRIEIYPDATLDKIDTYTSFKTFVVIGNNKFLSGDSIDWPNTVSYWIQGSNYVLRFIFPYPLMNDTTYIDLSSLKLK